MYVALYLFLFAGLLTWVGLAIWNLWVIGKEALKP